MKHFALFLLLVPLWQGFAQSPPVGAFHIGLNAFAPEWDPLNHTLHFVEGVATDTTTSNSDTLLNKLTNRQFYRAIELGANLINPNISPDYLRGTPNVVREICESAVAGSDTLLAMITDWGLLDVLGGERRMFHPEYAEDFSERGDFFLVNDPSFNNYPETGTNLSTELTVINPGSNSVLIEAGKGEISGVLNRELTVYRESWTGTEAAEKAASGLYHVSVIVKKKAAIANTNDTVMFVDVVTVHPTNSTEVKHHFGLTGHSFFEDDGDTITWPIEVNLGHIEVRETIDGITYIVRRVTNPAWTDVGLHKKERSIDTDFDVRIRPGNGDAKLLLDAVCLTDPNAFGLFAHNVPGVIAEHAGKRDSVTRRFREILSDDGARTQFPNLRYIAAPEVGFHTGTWTTISFGQTLLKQLAGESVTLYAAVPYSQDPKYSAAFNRRFAGGYYGYPIRSDYPRPTLDTTKPWSYHQKLHKDWERGFAELAFRYNNHAQKRGQYGSLSTAWLPYVQNHSNRFSSNIPEWDDDDPLREPTASELRSQCNVALAHGADGVMFYQYISSPWSTTEPFWPPDTTAWKADTAGGGARDLDPDMGNLGFLDQHLLPRTCDWNGENKFDSAKAYIHNFLAPVGNLVKTSLEWESSKLWSMRWLTYGGSNNHIATVVSRRQDLPNPVDLPDSTFVLVSEFRHRDDESLYLLVVNTRTHPIEGHRHITIKPAGEQGTNREVMVTKILGEGETGDIWIVRPNATPDTTCTANGFTDYFEPGSAALYRIEEIENETVQFAGACLGGNLYIEPAATLNLVNDEISFKAQKGILSEGIFEASGTTFRGCDPEIIWDGIWARNGGDVTLTNNCRVFSGRAGAGPGSVLALEERTEFFGSCDTCSVLNALGGEIISSGTEAEIPMYGKYLSAYYDSEVTLHADSAKALGANPGNIGINISGGFVKMRRTRLIDVHQGVSCRDIGQIYSRFSYTDVGHNRIRAYWIALFAAGGSTIDFGWFDYYALGAWGMANSIHVEDIDQGHHVYNMGGGSLVYADSSYWSHGVGQQNWPNPKTYGSCSVAMPLGTDPVPFTGVRESLSKITTSAPPPAWREALRNAIANNQLQSARNAISGFLRNQSSYSALADLSEIAHWTKELGLRELRDTLYTLLLTRQDVESKLLAADMAMADSLYADALEILNGYSFAGSLQLTTASLARKAVCHPMSEPGGYIRGLQALDSLKRLVGTDPVQRDFIELYPKLYSALSHSARRSTPKVHAIKLLDRVIPSTVEIGTNYPNPFSTLTSFTFKLPDACEVRLTVHDLLGREVAVLREGRLDRGIHSAVLHAERLTAGMYLYRLQAGAEVRQGKMVLVR